MNKQIGEKSDELWDLYDRDRNLTGRTHRRGDPLGEDEYHLVVHVCIFNDKGELLIQKRQPWKTGWPDMWDLSVGGSATVGDDSRRAAQREALEELGVKLDLSHEYPKFTINFDGGFDDYWIITRNIELSELSLQYEEVADAKWVSREELSDMAEKGEFIPYYFLSMLFDLKYTEGAIKFNS